MRSQIVQLYEYLSRSKHRIFSMTREVTIANQNKFLNIPNYIGHHIQMTDPNVFYLFDKNENLICKITDYYTRYPNVEYFKYSDISEYINLLKISDKYALNL